MATDDELQDIFTRECAREYLTEKYAPLDEARFEHAVAGCKGNWVDATVIYELLAIAETMNKD